MKAKNILDSMNGVDFNMIEDAEKNYKKNVNRVWMKWAAAAAACLCLVICGRIMMRQSHSNIPNPHYVQIANPIMEVNSIEEMEEYLDFSVPCLDKEVASYIVMVINGYPESGRIRYADGSDFNIKYGSGDISGIYGGSLEKTEKTNNVLVSYYVYENTRYAIWEKNGFTHSLTGGENLEAEVTALTH